MRIALYIALALIVIGIVITLFKKIAKSFIGKVAVIFLAVLLFGGGGSVINLNTLAPTVQEKVNQAVEVIGDSVIRQKGNKVEVKLGEEWYDVSKIGITENTTGTNERIVTIDGVEIPVGKSGIASTIDVLESVGLIKK